MADDNLIPPPSIGASATASIGGKKIKKGLSGGAKVGMIITLCVVVGVSLGIIVYQQSVVPKPSPVPRLTPTPSPLKPAISEVTPQANSITFPKAGEVRVYIRAIAGNPLTWGKLYGVITGSSGSSSVEFPGGSGAGVMSYQDIQMVVESGETLNYEFSYDSAGREKLIGYIKANGNFCGGVNEFQPLDVSSYINYVTQQVNGEPLVSIQCWTDDTPEEYDFNDLLIIWTYTPAGTASPVPSPSPSPSPSVKPSPSPSPSIKASPSPSPSVKASASVVASATPKPSVSPSPSPSVRVAQPTASELPEAGVFEVTAGTAGVAVLLTILGLLGLLLF